MADFIGTAAPAVGSRPSRRTAAARLASMVEERREAASIAAATPRECTQSGDSRPEEQQPQAEAPLGPEQEQQLLMWKRKRRPRRSDHSYRRSVLIYRGGVGGEAATLSAPVTEEELALRAGFIVCAGGGVRERGEVDDPMPAALVVAEASTPEAARRSLLDMAWSIGPVLGQAAQTGLMELAASLSAPAEQVSPPEDQLVAVAETGQRSSSRVRRGLQAAMTDKEFVRLQAILTDLPKHALGTPAPEVVRSGNTVERTASQRKTQADLVEAALLHSCLHYPRYAGELSRLAVVHANEDLAIFVDHKNQRLFTSLRGTNPLVPRDIGDDALIVLGYPPSRVDHARSVYKRVRGRFPGYKSYGCGHSLGGSVMHELAYSMEKDPDFAFTRVDVFNAGGSPLQRRYSALNRTQFVSHRVEGDLVSFFYEPPGGDGVGGTVVVHQVDPRFGTHRMGHFLPRKRGNIAGPRSPPECVIA